MILIFDYFETIIKNSSIDYNRGFKPLWEEYYRDKCSFEEITEYGNALFEHLLKVHEEGMEFSFLHEELPLYAKKYGGEVISMNTEEEADFLMLCNDTIPISGVEEMLEEFAQRNIPMYVLSNSGFSEVALSKVLERLGLGKYFKNVWSSADFGWIKPSRDFFEKAIDFALKENPDQNREDILFIGDTYETDIIGAHNAGLKSVWINRSGVADEKGYATYIISETTELKNIVNSKIRFLEEIAANGHVALDFIQYDGWILRFSNGYTNRANSVSVLYPSILAMDEKIDYCEKMYKMQGLPTVFKLTDADIEINEKLLNRGYEVVTPTDVMEISLDDLEISLEEDLELTFSFEPTAWLPDYFEFEEMNNEKNKETFRCMLSKVKIDPVYGALSLDGKVSACASIAIDQGYALLQNVVVSPAFRGRGLGKKICQAMIQKAKEQGADHVFLQVVQANETAMNLYKKLGFKKLYTYWYMKKTH